MVVEQTTNSCDIYHLVVIFSCWLSDFLQSSSAEGDSVKPLEFAQLPFAHPLYIMYSSGTTGAPKCMVHSQGVSLHH